MRFLLCCGKFFFLFFFVFSLTCYRVFFFFLLSGISLIMLLCYVLYVNFVILCYLAPFFLPVYVSISVTALVGLDFFPRWPWPITLSSSAFGKQLHFHRFSLISFCSRLKVVFLYCNYYFVLLFVGIYFYGALIVKTFADRERVVFLELVLARSFCKFQMAE